MALIPCGNRLLVRPDKVDERSEGGIYLARTDDKEKRAMDKGVVLSIGPICWIDQGKGDPWCKVDDYIYYARHSGKWVTDRETGEEILVLQDIDVVAIIKDKKEEPNE